MAYEGRMHADETVAHLKEKIEAIAGVPVPWQVVLAGQDMSGHALYILGLAGGDELKDSQLLSQCGTDLLQLQVFKLRDVLYTVAAGSVNQKYGAILALLAEARRGDHATSCVAAQALGCREVEGVALQLLAQTLPLQAACELLVEAVNSGSGSLRNQAAPEFARLLHEDSEALASATWGLAKELLEQLQKPLPRIPQRRALEHVPHTTRDPLEVAHAHLATYMTAARRMPSGWHYRSTIWYSGAFDFTDHWQSELSKVAAALDRPVCAISANLAMSVDPSFVKPLEGIVSAPWLRAT